jgi:hypothetical protein
MPTDLRFRGVGRMEIISQEGIRAISRWRSMDASSSSPNSIAADSTFLRILVNAPSDGRDSNQLLRDLPPISRAPA